MFRDRNHVEPPNSHRLMITNLADMVSVATQPHGNLEVASAHPYDSAPTFCEDQVLCDLPRAVTESKIRRGVYLPEPSTGAGGEHS
jgi:hypothetical protein